MNTMLQSLMVKNFAIIDNIHIEFKSGFTAITGETGAGKSLLIDAIGLLLGGKASPSMIRFGEQRAIIEGVFSNIGDQIKEKLDEYGLLGDEEDLLVIKKEINLSGKSLVRVNGFVTSLSQLEVISEKLADIHTQNDTKKLFEPKNYLHFIDNASSKLVLYEYQKAREQYLQALNHYQNICENIEEIQKEIDYLQYQYDVLIDAKLKENELEGLEEELYTLSNFEQIYQNLAFIIQKFKENNINDQIYEIAETLDKTSNMDMQYQNMVQIIKNAYYDLSDIESTIASKLEHLDFDEDRYNQVSERVHFLKDLMHKYKKTIPELLVYEQQLKQKLETIGEQDFLIQEAKQNLEQSYALVQDLANKLTCIRKENAKQLTHNIQIALADLLLDKVRIEIVFTKNSNKSTHHTSNFPKNGQDNVEIMIAFNPGESLKELSKVASGGEMSRVMLAIKTHLLSHLQLSTMIFDEIDSGVSGEVAYGVAKKLKEIAQFTQVLAITHLPIVASTADQQLFIHKKIEHEMTLTQVEELDEIGRVDVLASLISPNDTTGKSKELALLMLNNAKNVGN